MRELSPKEKLARDRICFPLDGIESVNQAKKEIESVLPVVGMFKIGKESFTRFGKEIVEITLSYKRKVFLDLKYHDIPNTVKGAAKAATESGVYMFTLHASGGIEMMTAAKNGVQEGVLQGCARPRIIAVTVLTSIDNRVLNNEVGVFGSVEEQVGRLAKNAEKAGMDGIVCSAADISHIHTFLKKDFMYVTPGITGVDSKAGYDQKRTFPPDAAIKAGSDILVIGRAISGAPNRIKAGLAIIQVIASCI